MEEQNNNMQTEKGNKVFVIIALLVVLLIAALVWQSQTKIVAPEEEDPVASEQGNILKRAKTYELIDGFEQEFIVDENGIVVDSVEAVTTRPSYKKLVTIYETTLTVEEIAEKYENFFEGSDWEVLDSSLEEEQSYFFARHLSLAETLQIDVFFDFSKGNVTVSVEYFKLK